ncbi:YdcF family protein [bacterium]|nr:YdcF family protein [bacterium]
MFLRVLFLTLTHLAVLGLGIGAGWGIWGRELTPETKPVPWVPDAIVILGGGDKARVEEGVKAAAEYPAAPVVITGNANWMREQVGDRIQPESRILMERDALNTWGDAEKTRAILDRFGSKKVLLVTNWFHARRALATFRKVQPGRTFAMRFSPKPKAMQEWDQGQEKRERMAAVFYLFRYGVWAF